MTNYTPEEQAAANARAGKMVRGLLVLFAGAAFAAYLVLTLL